MTLLNEILADTTVLYAMYKKHHWLVAGPTFYQLHLLFDKHEVVIQKVRAGIKVTENRTGAATTCSWAMCCAGTSARSGSCPSTS